MTYRSSLSHSDTSWYGKLLQLGGRESDSDSLTNTESEAADEVRTMTSVITNLSPHMVTGVRSLPHKAGHNIVKTKFGTARLFSNPLDARPDIIYHHPHHYNDLQSDNVYETISHCKNLKNSVI